MPTINYRKHRVNNLPTNLPTYLPFKPTFQISGWLSPELKSKTGDSWLPRNAHRPNAQKGRVASGDPIGIRAVRRLGLPGPTAEGVLALSRQFLNKKGKRGLLGENDGEPIATTYFLGGSQSAMMTLERIFTFLMHQTQITDQAHPTGPKKSIRSLGLKRSCQKPSSPFFVVTTHISPVRATGGEQITDPKKFSLVCFFGG